jgi:2-dehydropantoate 2-reductase
VSFPADWQGPGHIEQGGFGNIWIGELDGRITERLKVIENCFPTPSLRTSRDNVVGYLWSKQIDCSLLFAQAVGDQTFADTFGDARYQPVLTALVGEGVVAAVAAGVKLGSFGAFEPLKLRPARRRRERGARRAEPLRRPDAHQIKVRSGPWRDLAVRKRPTEVDYMVGWVIGEGRRRGVAMPLNEALVRQVKELENGTRKRGLHNLDELEALRGKALSFQYGTSMTMKTICGFFLLCFSRFLLVRKLIRANQ